MPLPRSTREAIPVGQAVAHFRVAGTLGEGGMGIVYIADDEKLHRKVALKILHPDVAGNSQRRRRFLREARVAGSVTHPSIATVYEVGESDGRIYIAMELVEGTSLKKRLERGPIPFSEAVRIARLVARGLVKAHEAGIIHRDLKPDNIMVGDDEIVKILDFGLAKPREKEQARPELWSGQGIESDDDPSTEIETARWALVGTPSYMSPEQAKGREVDERTDIFSLGVILYEMLSGKRPFKGETWQEVIISINRDNPLPPSVVNPDAPKVVDALVMKCMEKEASRRFATCRDLVAAIDEALGRESLFDSGMRAVPPGAPAVVAAAMAPAASPSNPENALALGAQPSPAPVAPPSADVEPPRETERPASKAGLVGGLVAGLVFGTALLVVARQRLHAGDADPSASSSAPAASSAITAPAAPKGAVTDHPLPKTDKPEARAAYGKALQSLRDASISMAGQQLRAAVDADPELAAGALRHILYPAIGGSRDERRGYFQTANQLRASLSDRDQALLRAIEPVILPDLPDRAEAQKRAVEVAKKFPDDAEVALVLAQAELDVDHTTQAEQAADRALAIDPKYAMAAWMKAIVAEAEGDAHGVLRAASECLAITPAAASCLRMKAEVEVLNGECSAFETDARQMVAVEPQGNLAHLWLARALAAKGAPSEAVWEVLQNQSKMLAERLRPEVEHQNKASVAALYGDFATAEKELTDLQEALVSTQTESGHASSLALVALYREIGDLPKAGKTAKEYLDKKAAWVADDATLEASMIAAAQHVELITKQDAAQRRDKTLAALKAQLPAGVANATWLYAYAWPAETAEEAREALALMKDYTPLPSTLSLEDLPIAEGLLGKVYALAGKADDAIPLLKRATSACLQLSFPFESTWMTYQLGQTLETKGDTAGACGAYKLVVDRWGQAKPRSTTADKARARIAALVCNR